VQGSRKSLEFSEEGLVLSSRAQIKFEDFVVTTLVRSKEWSSQKSGARVVETV